ncbi:hypothetical protein C7B82_17160 [Stenomitos frigidus ULC18]|uniref:Uncharacterized protein n=1 Tax=Stenomitos frigidus ULC18 TaxID=2107698 RepID=A0A2T1E3B2_9CYAN|nr:hypothetical protein C7B82_17160 [Stenomitos frigidus ULC18]
MSLPEGILFPMPSFSCERSIDATAARLDSVTQGGTAFQTSSETGLLVSYQLSAISYQLSAISYQLSVF